MSIMRGRLLARTMLTGAAGPLLIAAGIIALPAAASAQEVVQTAQAEAAAERETIVVTGTRLQSRDLVAASPISTISDEALEDTATITVETLLNTLPQVVPSFGSGNNNPGNGQSLINLRGLGSIRNVVLVNGRRVVPHTSTLAVDANTIPAALVERVEIISGGASAVYGADAVAGVTNFILKDDFKGIELSGDFLSTTEFADAEEKNVALTMGGDFDDGRGNAVFHLSHAMRDELTKGQRDFTSQAASATSFFPSGTYRTAGNTPTQAAVNAVFGGYGVGAGLVPTTGGSTGFGFNGDGTLFSTGTSGAPDVQNFRRDPSEIATAFYPNFFSFNFEPYNKLILPFERTTFYGATDYDIADNWNVYANANYVNYSADTALAPSPAPTAANPLYPGLNLNEFTIPVTNPFIPADLAALLASRTGNNPALAGSGATEEFAYRFRTLALGPRLSSNDRSSMQWTVGSVYEVPNTDWSIDAYYSWGKYDETETQTGNLNVRRFEQLLDAPDGGAAICGDGFNPFGVGFLGEGCADYVSVIAKNRTEILAEFGQIVGTGTIVNLPAGPLQAAFGAETRKYRYVFTPDSALQPGEVAGFNGSPALEGDVDFVDYFTEVSIPVLADLPLVQSLDLVLGARSSNSNITGVNSSYKAELNYAINDMVMLRGSLNRAVRSPNVSELFSPQSEDNPEVFDPCNALLEDGSTNTARTAAIVGLCQTQAQAIGLTFNPAYVQGNAQVNALTGGNPNLDAETADTWTAGAVFQHDKLGPISNISASIDYYSISIEDVIASNDPTVIVNRCFNLQDNANPTLDANNSWCQLFQRSPGDFSIVELLQLDVNQATWETSGIDVAFGFNIETADLMGADYGTLGFSTAWNWTEKFTKQTSSADPTLDYVGTIGVDPGDYLPEYKGSFTLSYNLDKFGLDVRTRYLDNAKHKNDVPVEDATSTGVPATWYVDVAADYSVTDNLTLKAGLLNALDQDIRQYDPFVDSQTDPSTYDVIGRRFYVGANLTF